MSYIEMDAEFRNEPSAPREVRRIARTEITIGGDLKYQVKAFDQRNERYEDADLFTDSLEDAQLGAHMMLDWRGVETIREAV